MAEPRRERHARAESVRQRGNCSIVAPFARAGVEAGASDVDSLATAIERRALPWNGDGSACLERRVYLAKTRAARAEPGVAGSRRRGRRWTLLALVKVRGPSVGRMNAGMPAPRRTDMLT